MRLILVVHDVCGRQRRGSAQTTTASARYPTSHVVGWYRAPVTTHRALVSAHGSPGGTHPVEDRGCRQTCSEASFSGIRQLVTNSVCSGSKSLDESAGVRPDCQPPSCRPSGARDRRAPAALGASCVRARAPLTAIICPIFTNLQSPRGPRPAAATPRSRRWQQSGAVASTRRRCSQ